MAPPLVADDEHAGPSDDAGPCDDAEPGAKPSAEDPDELLDHKAFMTLERAYQDKLHKQIRMGGVEDGAYGVVFRAPKMAGEEPKIVDQSKLTTQQKERFMALSLEKYAAMVHAHEALVERHGKRVPQHAVDLVEEIKELAAGPYNFLELIAYVADKWEDEDAPGYSSGGGVVKPFRCEKEEMMYVELDDKRRELANVGGPVLLDTVEHRQRRQRLQQPSIDKHEECEEIREEFRQLQSPEVRAAVAAAAEGKAVATSSTKRTGWRYRKQRAAVMKGLEHLREYKAACKMVSGPMPTKPKKPAGKKPVMPANFDSLPEEAKRKWKQEAKAWQALVRFYNKDVDRYNKQVATRMKEIEAAEKVGRKAIRSLVQRFPNYGGFLQYLEEVRTLRPWNQPLSAEELARKEQKRKRDAEAAEEERQKERAERLDWACNNAWANKHWVAAEDRYDAIETKDGDGYGDEDEDEPRPKELSNENHLLHPAVLARSKAAAAARAAQQQQQLPPAADEPAEPPAESAEKTLDARLKKYADDCREARKKKLAKKAKLAFEGKPGKLTTVAKLKQCKDDIADAARALQELTKGSYLYRIERGELFANMWKLQRNMFTLKRATAKPEEPDEPEESAPERAAKKAKKDDKNGAKLVDLFKLFYATPQAPSAAAQAAVDADAVFEEGGEGEGATDVATPRECARA